MAGRAAPESYLPGNTLGTRNNARECDEDVDRKMMVLVKVPAPKVHHSLFTLGTRGHVLSS